MVFDDEIAVWQIMEPNAHPTQFWKIENIQDKQQS